jgi:Protein of unknown function (DUF3995)
VAPASFCTRTAAAGLTAIAGVHVIWATGSSWPARDRAALADAVVGRRDGEVPSPAACFAVAGLLVTAAGVVGARGTRLRRLGARAVVAVLALRGGAGLAGRTDILSPGSSSPRFRELDRRFYAPLCLTLAALSLPATVATVPATGGA